MNVCTMYATNNYTDAEMKCNIFAGKSEPTGLQTYIFILHNRNIICDGLSFNTIHVYLRFTVINVFEKNEDLY